MYRKFSLLAILILVNGCASTQVARPKVSKNPLENYPQCQVKMPVAIDRFKTENVSFDWWNDNVAADSREVAVEDLVNSGCYTVLEREDAAAAPQGIMNEKALARSDEGKPGAKAGQYKQMKVAENLMSFALTGLSKDKSGFDFGLLTGIAGALIGGTAGDAVGAVGAEVRGNTIHMACKYINTSTTEIMASAQVKVDASSFGLSFDTGAIKGGSFGVGEIAYFKKSKLGQMMADVVHKCAVQLTQNYYRTHGAPTAATFQSDLDTKPAPKKYKKKRKVVPKAQ